ncbi:four helix bundle protein [Methylobacterium sp. NEAU 140]|uniref:four helix bundle protein n=1 Tax=Methylobacterium sp. NEAU 140 TaxID=3064945 RepID=UPI00273588CA|nr:four helix bundle protein [Methylobacterium sp. NEAU 140]MDP4025630.1 four helix bundle protein [Methylobacterium sp. NEAU 140]
MERPAITSYRDLKVWQEAMALAEACYGETREFPREEMFGLTAQIRRAATSVAANIAEGHGRETGGSFVQFLRVAQGSLKELETHIILSDRVGLLAAARAEPLLGRCEEIGKMLRALIRALQKQEGSR